MARIDLARRAQIGLRRRVKSRSELMQAARALLSTRPADAITVEEVTSKAGVAKGTFYIHFENLDDLRAAVIEELTSEFDELLQVHRAMVADPVERIASGCMAFVAQALRDPAWGALSARGIWACPPVARAVSSRLSEDLHHAIEQGRLAAISAELGFDIVVGVVLQAMRSASERKLTSRDVPLIVSAVLRALGLATDEADRIARRASKLAIPEPDGRHSRHRKEQPEQHEGR
jgi:AcrR family transcriptional regulator